MPCLRGIEVSLTTKPENEPIPEYPHPEGVSTRILGALTSRTNGQAVHRKAGPTVAVYIPSIPGTRFAVNYSINNAPPAPCKYILFRLYINARPIAAWGIDPDARPKGRVVKSLWAPRARYQDQIGFEGRNYVFLPDQPHKSVAEDGGHIEIQVFRAQERRARAPRLEEFGFQENDGIASPTIGLLDEPHNACFHDWHLLDAKDSPYARFRLHYRSWQNLKQLNLIPSSELELLCSHSPKALRLIAKMEAALEVSGDDDDDPEKHSSPSGNSDEAVFDDCQEEPDGSDGRDRETPFCFLKKPPEIFPAVSSGFRIPQPSKALRDASRESYLQRPLPELPVEEPIRDSRRSSAASAVSSTLSITPSLLQYVDEESINPDEIEVGVAQLVELPPSESSLRIVPDEEPNHADNSISDYETSSKSTRDSFLGKLSPGRYLPMTGNGLERGIALFTSPTRSIFSRASNARQYLPSDLCSPRGQSQLDGATLRDTNYVAGSPSAARSTADKDPSRRESSPSIGRGAGMSLFAGLRKKKATESPSKPTGMRLGRDNRNLADSGRIVKRTIGSWM